jgi:hypothetical protein
MLLLKREGQILIG